MAPTGLACAVESRSAKSDWKPFPMSRTASNVSRSSSAMRRSVPAPSAAMLVAAIAAIVLGIDQLTKAIVVDSIGPESEPSRVELGSRWIALEYAENRGAAFGL